MLRFFMVLAGIMVILSVVACVASVIDNEYRLAQWQGMTAIWAGLAFGYAQQTEIGA